jgi:hypothetical protein
MAATAVIPLPPGFDPYAPLYGEGVAREMTCEQFAGLARANGWSGAVVNLVLDRQPIGGRPARVPARIQMGRLLCRITDARA